MNEAVMDIHVQGYSLVRVSFSSLDKCRGIWFLNNRDRLCFLRICQTVFGRDCASCPPARSVFVLFCIHVVGPSWCHLVLSHCCLIWVPLGQELWIKFSCPFFFAICLSSLLKCSFKCLLHFSALVSWGEGLTFLYIFAQLFCVRYVSWK